MAHETDKNTYKEFTCTPHALAMRYGKCHPLVCASHGPTADAQQTRPLNQEFRLHENFQSNFLTKDRDVIVWLPPGYSEPAKRPGALHARWRQCVRLVAD